MYPAPPIGHSGGLAWSTTACTGKTNYQPASTLPENVVAWFAKRDISVTTLTRNRIADDAPTIEAILETARAAVRRHGIRGLVIDPYNEIEHKRPPAMTETEYVSQMLSQVKRFAQNHGVHVWFVAHPAKPMRLPGNSKAQVPTLYDISGSANWVNKADIGIVVHRDPAQYPTTEIHIRKVRFRNMGKIGVVNL